MSQVFATERSMFSLFLRAAALAAATLPPLAAAAPITLDQAIERAVQRSESARSARAGVRSAAEAASAADQLPDPMLGMSIENLPVTGPDRFSTTREGMTMKRIALSQEWVGPDKRRLRTEAARAQVGRQAATLAAAVAEARLQTALAYVDAYYAGEALKLAALGESHAREASVTARAQLAAGSAGAQDALASSAAQGVSADEAAEARQQHASAQVALARWTGPVAGELSAPAWGTPPPEAQWVDRSAAVLAGQRELELALKEAASVAANRRPNWTWEVAYGQRGGAADLVSVGVSIPLPVAVAARQDRDTAARLALVEKAEADLAEALRGSTAEYRALASDSARLQERIQAFEAAVLAPASQRAAVARAALAGNQGGLAMVFEARHAELEARRKLLGLQRDLARVRAQLMFKPVTPEDLP
jgi:outer membrane protein TolC